MNKKWVIYKHTNKKNGKIYIGQTCQEVEDRYGKNGYRYQKSAPLFWKAIQKYGWDNFEHDIIENNIKSLKEVNEREKYWIKYYDCCVLDGKDKGYNMDRGGKGFSPEQASILSKENWKNEDYRKKFCKPVICVNTQKIYKSIVEASEDTNINKTGIAKACAKIHNSAGIDDKGNPIQWEFYEEGKKYEYQDPKLKNKRLTKVICVTTGEIFNSIKEACEKYKVQSSCISSCIYGKQKTSGQLADGTRLCWALYEEEKEYKKITNSGKSNKKVKCLETEEIFNSIKEAAESVNVQAPNMSAHLHGRQKSCGKDKNNNPLHWIFYNENEDYEE